MNIEIYKYKEEIPSFYPFVGTKISAGFPYPAGDYNQD